MSDDVLVADEAALLAEFDAENASALATLVVEECHERGWSLRELAERMGGDDADADVDECALHFLIGCDDELSMRLGEKTAHGLARAFGTSASFWLNLDEHRRRKRA